MLAIRYVKCGRKWRVIAHEGVVNEGFYCRAVGGEYGNVFSVGLHVHAACTNCLVN